MKCLLHISVISGGGAERVLCQLSNHLVKSSEVILLISRKTKFEYELDSKIKKVYLEDELKRVSFVNQIRFIRLMIQKESPDVCISFLPEPNFRLLLAKIGLKVKTLISVRNDPEKEYSSFIYKRLAYFLYPMADGIVFQTEGARKWFPDRIQRKSQIIMNQVSSTFFLTRHIEEQYFVATGRLSAQKNYYLMIDAFSKIIQKYPDEQLRIYGDGELKDELQAYIDNLNADNNIMLMGRTDDIAGVLSHAKGFLLSSDFEGMPNGLLEALAVGIPCVSTDCPCGGPDTVIENDVNGILTPVNDVNEFHKAILEIVENTTSRLEMGRKAKIKAKDFSPEKVFEDWMTYIDKLTAIR